MKLIGLLAVFQYLLNRIIQSLHIQFSNPIYPEETEQWQRASFADSTVIYYMKNNIAQPDLGDFVKERHDLQKMNLHITLIQKK